ncbi:MAG: malate synthase A [marine benthic group bacterium]|nr:malate synthase A [Gemmatimonadota bacterium]
MAEDSNRTREQPGSHLELTAPIPPGCEEILTAEALDFVTALVREFRPRRDELLERRQLRQAQLDAGDPSAGPLLDFLPETAPIRDADWSVARIPPDLRDRRVEITGPVERKMIINALNSGASCFMADFEDSNSPTWENVVRGQQNLHDAVRRTITFTNPDGKHYELAEQTATLHVRPRGWHLPEKHVLLDGNPIPASLFDFGLFLFHNGRELLDRGSGPYFYLPKLESHLEARLWNDVFVAAQDLLDIPRGSIRATVLIETLPAAFEMDEILWELREHSAGLNCGRWDYIFSLIKTFRAHPEFVLPDRAMVTMTTHCMHSYSLLAIRTCHRRGIHAMGGMAAQIPIKGDPEANQAALDKVRQDKIREAGDGHDGTWVAHPGLVEIARKAFDDVMPGPNQIERLREDVDVTATDLLKVPGGEVTERGVRHNIDVGIQYMAAWLDGNGCVPIYHLMEDAATAEISRSQLWQWLRYGVQLAGGATLDPDSMSARFDEELERLRAFLGDEHFESGRYRQAKEMIEEMVVRGKLADFMTLRGYEELR